MPYLSVLVVSGEEDIRWFGARMAKKKIEEKNKRTKTWQVSGTRVRGPKTASGVTRHFPAAPGGTALATGRKGKEDARRIRGKNAQTRHQL